VRWPALRPEVCTLTQTPEDGAARVKERQTELEALLRRFDEELPRHPSLRIEDESLVVGPLHAEDRPSSLVALEALIDAISSESLRFRATVRSGRVWNLASDRKRSKPRRSLPTSAMPFQSSSTIAGSGIAAEFSLAFRFLRRLSSVRLISCLSV
jgi:hypothetical protein